ESEASQRVREKDPRDVGCARRQLSFRPSLRRLRRVESGGVELRSSSRQDRRRREHGRNRTTVERDRERDCQMRRPLCQLSLSKNSAENWCVQAYAGLTATPEG